MIDPVEVAREWLIKTPYKNRGNPAVEKEIDAMARVVLAAEAFVEQNAIVLTLLKDGDRDGFDIASKTQQDKLRELRAALKGGEDV